MPLSPEELAELRDLGGARTIVVTNADHVRAAPELKEELGARIVAPECERERMEGVAVDEWFTDADGLGPGLSERWEVHWLRGGKQPLEAAIYVPAQGLWIFGDAVRSHESGRLRLLPDPKIADRRELEASVKALAGRDVQAVLLGDGDCIFNGAREALDAFVESLSA
jgi:glyoxylase-like metal-dependent hydrolase (beta-lactamase superfamily II)